MSFSPTSGQVVLKEIFDEGSIPTDEEIFDYALRIGIDVDSEPHLLYLARDGLMQALPAGWKPCYDKDKKEIYYFNFKTKKTQWEHPLDDIYRNLVKKARNESAFSEQIDDDSRTSIKEDLKSFEEASFILTANEMYFKPKKLEPLSPLGKSILKKVPVALSPTKKTIAKDLVKSGLAKSPLHIDEEKLLFKSEIDDPQKRTVFDETEVRKRPNSSDIRNRRNIGPMEFRHLSKQEIITPNALEKLNFLTETKKLIDNKIFSESPSIEVKGSESGIVTKDEGYGTEFSVSSLGEKDIGAKKELTLAGGGSIFLKSNKMKFSPSSDLVTSSLSREELSEGLLSPDARKSGPELDSHPKSILRDQNTQKIIEKASVGAVERKSRKDIVDDERKSVRFNLEKTPQISFEIPSPTKEESENVVESVDNDFSLKQETEEKQEARQIDIDFDDLDICLSEEKSEKLGKEAERVPMDSIKTVEPKKFKPSQMLVKEFREIFENKTKNNINLLGISQIENAKNSTRISSRSNSSSSRSTTSQSEDNPHFSQETKPCEKDKANQAENSVDLSVKETDCKKPNDEKLHSSVFDSTFEDLVDFAIKKKLGVDSPKDDESKILYRERDFLLEEILKGNDSDSVNESDGDNILISESKEMEYLEKLESQINLSAQKRRELEDLVNYEKNKNEKLNEMEREFKIWFEEAEESFKQKKEEASVELNKKYESWLQEQESEFEKTFRQKCKDEMENRMKELKNELAISENLELEALKSRLDLEQKERLQNLKLEIEEREAKELDSLRKSFEDNLNERKTELLKKHREEIVKIEQNLEDVLSEQKSQKLKELELVRENEAVIEVMRLEMKESYQKQKNSLMREHELLLENMKQEHALALEQLKIEFKNEEDSMKKAHFNRLEEIKIRMNVTEDRKTCENLESSKSENAEARVFEKVRCEKRLLEDKYKTLKEKYIRLKTDAKSSLEKKKKKKESSKATGSETEKSSSNWANSDFEKVNNDSPNQQRKQDKEKRLRKQINQLECFYHDVSTEDEENLMSPKNLSHFQKSFGVSDSKKKQVKNEEKLIKSSSNSERKEELSGEDTKLKGSETKKKRQLFSRFKAVSTSKINCNNKNQVKEVLSPVENLRRQLKKLEELEDQFPVATYTDTYMRYPFTDNAQFGSSEIEFFKHRIHLERESVRRAKNSLKAQKKSFENRQRELKQKLVDGEPGSKAIIDQIYQEEKELTDMEVSVYRTRALLGEKIIRLRHLEQSLKRISQPLKKDSFTVKGKDFLGRLGVRNQSKDDEKTLSDLSSYSGSSGFSSTDFNDVHPPVGVGVKKMNLDQNKRHFQNNMQESSEIIQSLENLNSEIREIWEVLKKHQQSGQETITTLPPPPLIYGDLGWSAFTLSPPLPFRNTVITSTTNLQRPMAQQFKTRVTGPSNLSHVSTIIDSSLIDRTRSLRDWLKAAKNSTQSEAINSSQVTL